MIDDAEQYSNRQNPETPKDSRLSGRSVNRRESLRALVWARTREQIACDSPQIAQIAEMGLPAHVEILASRDSCGVVMSVEQLLRRV